MTDWYVDAVAGSDGNDGSLGAPFRTITHGLSVAVAGQTVHVQPGTYAAATGETFPLVVPAGVVLVGDEANQGGGATPTQVTGGGLVPAPNANAFLMATLVPGAGSTVAGLRITNDLPYNPLYPYGVVLQASSVVLRNDDLHSSYSGIQCSTAAATGHVLLTNRIRNHGGVGLSFHNGAGVGTRVQGNVITGNAYGVEYDSAGGDLGGGAAGSGGLNTLSCNTVNDLWTATAAITIDAQNNLWDHVAPSGNDLFNAAGATIVTTGAALTASPCP